jgi:hypothetical protein
MITKSEALILTFGWRSVRRSLMVALVVGTALNAINQGSELLHGDGLIIWKFLLTYFVPFAVASYGCYAALCDGHAPRAALEGEGAALSPTRPR